jgi:hypothetical protein
MTASILLAWLQLLALDGKLAKAEPKPCVTASSTLPAGLCAEDAAGS